jgi:tRNA threonylcarbamoyladenosine biosynthesis protein TsaE
VLANGVAMAVLLTKTFNYDELSDLGKAVAELMQHGQPMFLYGEMGAGKTTLTKHIIKALGTLEEVTSPTFNIMQSYNTDKGSIWHVDLYRLKNRYEIEELGLYEMFAHNMFIIEWPERFEGYLFKPHLKAILKINSDQTRTLTIEQSL